MVIKLKRKYLVILSLILCISLGLSSVSAGIIVGETNLDIDDDVTHNDSNDYPIKKNDVKKNDKNDDSVKASTLSTYVKLDQVKIASSKPSTVTANVYSMFNGVNSLIKTGNISLYINGNKKQSIDLSNCNGIVKFSIPPLSKNDNCKIVYEGGKYKDDEFDFKLSSSSKEITVGDDDSHPLHTTIKIVPSTISGFVGNVAKVSAKVVFNFNDVESIATKGDVYLLKDGVTLHTADLSRNNNPSFSFKLEKGHKYSLIYSGAEDDGEFDLHLLGSSKDLNVKVLEKNNKEINKTSNNTDNQTNITDNQTVDQDMNQIVEPNNQQKVNMQTTGLIVAILIIVIIIIGSVIYFKKR